MVCWCSSRRRRIICGRGLISTHSSTTSPSCRPSSASTTTPTGSVSTFIVTLGDYSLFSASLFFILTHFWATVTSNGSPYATGPLSCLSVCAVTLMYCGQTVGWIKMPFGMEVGLHPGDIVLDGNPAPPTERGTATPPLFGLCLLWPNGRPS